MDRSDFYTLGLEGLPAVLSSLADPTSRNQGPALTCLLQALCRCAA